MEFGMVYKYPLLLSIIDDTKLIYKNNTFLKPFFVLFLLSKDFIKSSERDWKAPEWFVASYKGTVRISTKLKI